MKKLLVAAFACMLGISAIAAVEGNNTAVVIRKKPVVSDNGYQYLCLPVCGFDITGQGGANALPLNDVIPPSTPGFTAGTIELIVEGNLTGEGYVGNGTYALVNVDGTNQWQASEGTDATTSISDQDLVNGARIWLKVTPQTTTETVTNGTTSSNMDSLLGSLGLAAKAPAANTATAEPTATAMPETIFAGEQVTLKEGEKLLSNVTIESGKMIACGNNTAEPIDIRTQLLDSFQNRDQILRVQEGSDEYCYIFYNDVVIDGNGTKAQFWDTVGQNADPTKDETYMIAPGEAFYFFRVK